jgi:hypothetical protein
MFASVGGRVLNAMLVAIPFRILRCGERRFESSRPHSALPERDEGKDKRSVRQPWDPRGLRVRAVPLVRKFLQTRVANSAEGVPNVELVCGGSRRAGGGGTKATGYHLQYR